MIFIYHYKDLLFNNNESFFYNIISQFHIAVSGFFVLSGFLISHNYFISNNNKMKLINFYLLRFIRIFPIFFILSTLTYTVHSFQLPLDFKLSKEETELFLPYLFRIYLLDITFLKNLIPEFFKHGIVQGWSLSVEFYFYLISPLLFYRGKPRFFFLLSFIFLGVFLINNNYVNSHIMDLQYFFWYTIFGRVFEFFLGGILAYFYYNNKIKSNYDTTLLSLLIIFLFIVFFIYYPQHSILINNFLLPLFGISFFLYSIIYHKSKISNLLSSNFFILLGKSSFIFYLINLGVFADVTIKSLSFLKISNDYLTLLLLFIIISCLSICIYIIIEKPIYNFFRKLILY